MRAKTGGGTCNKLRLSGEKTVTWLQNIACGELTCVEAGLIMSNEDKETGVHGGLTDWRERNSERGEVGGR